jgi:hypothetical protein
VENVPRIERLLMWTIAGPCVVLALLSAWWTGDEAIGNGLWPPDEVTLSEAVATRNNAEAVRLIEHGADKNGPSRVRDGLLTNGYAVTVKPIEAAVGAQRADSVRMLLANGVAVDEGERRVLRCLEQTRHDTGVRELLGAGSEDDVTCDRVRSPLEKAHHGG